MESETPHDAQKQQVRDTEQTAPDGREGGTRSFPWWKVAVLVMVAAAIGTTLALKHAGNDEQKRNQEDGAGSPAGAVVRKQDRGADEETDGRAGEDSDRSGALAKVNGETITRKEFQSARQGLPSYYRRGGTEVKQKVLDMLIERNVLLQEADEQGIEKPTVRQGRTCCGSSPEWKRDTARIRALIGQEALFDVNVTEQEMREYYRENRDSYGEGRSFEDLKSRIEQALRRKKEQQAAEQYVAEVKKQVEVRRADNPFSGGGEKSAPQNPLKRALQKDMPVLADFGRDKCTPCKMMKPILKDLKDKYEGQAEVLIINTTNYPDLARSYNVRAIPTQIFFDASGQEVARHSGFMPREDLVEKLGELGVK